MGWREILRADGGPDIPAPVHVPLGEMRPLDPRNGPVRLPVCCRSPGSILGLSPCGRYHAEILEWPPKARAGEGVQAQAP